VARDMYFQCIDKESITSLVFGTRRIRLRIVFKHRLRMPRKAVWYNRWELRGKSCDRD